MTYCREKLGVKRCPSRHQQPTLGYHACSQTTSRYQREPRNFSRLSMPDGHEAYVANGLEGRHVSVHHVLLSSPSSAVEQFFLFVFSCFFIFADVGSSCRLRFPTGRPPSLKNGCTYMSLMVVHAPKTHEANTVLKISLYDYHNNTSFCFRSAHPTSSFDGLDSLTSK